MCLGAGSICWTIFTLHHPFLTRIRAWFSTSCRFSSTVFFMALLFFVSGLFVWKSIVNKGSIRFLLDRLLRLGIPFLVMVGIIMPLAYYPSFLQTGAEESFISYWSGWSWRSGPAWFLSLLIVFDLLAAICFQFAAHSNRSVPQIFFRQPSSFF